MSTIVTFLANLKLSLKQILVGLIIAIVGGLVVALKLQGSKLHKVQVDLLRATYDNKVSAQDVDVQEAKDKFMAALNEYEKGRN